MPKRAFAPDYHRHVALVRSMCLAAAIAAAAMSGGAVAARQSAIDVAVFGETAWRLLGPFHGGRTTIAAGVGTEPHVFYVGTPNGGVWKTSDAGRTWRPIFDQQATGSIGSIAVAPSQSSVVYVGTGAMPLDHESGTRGLGLFKSNDAGRTWVHLGLTNDRHLTAVIVDPTNADRLFVASSGHSLSPGPDRGIYRSTNGGRSFEKVFSGDEQIGALDLAFDPSNLATVYAGMVDWGHASMQRVGAAPALIIKSVDGGTTWAAAGVGLPTAGAGAIRLASAASDPRRLFAALLLPKGTDLYRSDDGARSWSLVHAGDAPRDTDRGRVSVVVDPSNADIVYLTGSSTRRSTDGGRTFSVWTAAPAGRPARALWINPSTPAIRILATDRGALVSVNGGETWSSASNQPTGQFVEVATDAAFPYRVCGVAREDPTGCLPSRGPGGRVATADWRPVASGAGVAVAPDPQDADIVYTAARGRFDRRSGQTQYVGPAPADVERGVAGGRLVFAADHRTLYYGSNVLWRGVGGQNWSAISSDLTRGEGVISAIAPSAIDSRIVWVGTDDGLIHVTRDAGVSWSSRSPAALAARWSVRSIEPSHFDVNTAYAAANATATNDHRPHLWRTRDGGTSWQAITAGLPDEAVVHSVREDSLRRGMLFAGTAASVFVSFDDGDRWQPLRLNLPPVPVSDLTIKDSDVAIATDGRGLWVLDDISPFRQITADLVRSEMFLFRPAIAWRTPPVAAPAALTDPDDGAGVNAPDGVPITYLAGSNVAPVTIEIIETSSGDVIRRFEPLPGGRGLQRVFWDLQYTPMNGRGVWVMPGTYQVRLTSGTRIARQAVIVRMDPRVRASVTDLTAQFKLSRSVDDQRRAVAAAMERLGQTPAGSEVRRALVDAAAALDRALDVVQQADGRPTPAAEATAAAALSRAATVLSGLP